MKKIITAVAAFAACISMNAQVTVEITPFTIEPGESKTITLDLTNGTNPVGALTCDIYLPEGITIDMEDEEYMLDFTTRAVKGFSCESALREDGAVRIATFNTKGKPYDGESGAILEIPITAAAGIAECVTSLTIDNIDATNAEGTVTYVCPKYVGEVIIGKQTGIQNVGAATSSKTIYSITGAQLSSPQRGLNIVNGKKVVMK